MISFVGCKEKCQDIIQNMHAEFIYDFYNQLQITGFIHNIKNFHLKRELQESRKLLYFQ